MTKKKTKKRQVAQVRQETVNLRTGSSPEGKSGFDSQTGTPETKLDAAAVQRKQEDHILYLSGYNAGRADAQIAAGHERKAAYDLGFFDGRKEGKFWGVICTIAVGVFLLIAAAAFKG